MREAAPVRLEIRTRGDQVHAVREERAWPPPGVQWVPLYLAPGKLRTVPLAARATAQFQVPEGEARFAFRFPEDTELTGPMKLRLYVELVGGLTTVHQALEPLAPEALHLAKNRILVASPKKSLLVPTLVRRRSA